MKRPIATLLGLKYSSNINKQQWPTSWPFSSKEPVLFMEGLATTPLGNSQRLERRGAAVGGRGEEMRLSLSSSHQLSMVLR